MEFLSIIAVTLAFWAVVLGLSYISIRTARRLIGWRVIKWFVLGAGVLFIVRIGVADDAFSHMMLFDLAIAALSFMGIFVVIIFSFMVYHGLKHGSPMREYQADPILVKKVEQVVKREKKWCIICKHNSGCRVRRNPYTGMTVHVIR